MSVPTHTARGARTLFALAAVSGALAVAMGAFGAHALEDMVSPARLETWRTGAAYALGHATPALLASAMAAWSGQRAAYAAAILFLMGTVLFSGGLYALVLLDLPVLGAVAPLGGVSFIAGWIALAWSGWRLRAG
ncbi:MAG: DUF423 domain-containing protein [Rubricoccaceae bacterium]